MASANINHSIARKCVHCCKGNAASQWERAILGCLNSVIPEPIDQKFYTRDYVCELTSYAKFHIIRATRAAGNMVKCTPRILFKIFLQEISREALQIK